MKVRRSKAGIVQNKVISISVRIRTQDYGKLIKIAALEDRPMAQVVRRLIRAKIKHCQDKGLID